MKQEEISQLTIEDLNDRLISSKDKMEKLILSHNVSYLENPIQIKSLRRTIARLKTELNKRSQKA